MNLDIVISPVFAAAAGRPAATLHRTAGSAGSDAGQVGVDDDVVQVRAAVRVEWPAAGDQAQRRVGDVVVDVGGGEVGLGRLLDADDREHRGAAVGPDDVDHVAPVQVLDVVED